jgi:hypothetical protein
MSSDTIHSACVDAWLARAATGLDREALVGLFEAALGALWARANVTLGDVTLTAIVDRVLYNARERFPGLSSLELGESGGVVFDALRGAHNSSTAEKLHEGIRFTLVELLTVLGNLTADILTPELHAELSKIGARTRTPGTEGTSR